jgi:hypothetical protein
MAGGSGCGKGLRDVSARPSCGLKLCLHTSRSTALIARGRPDDLDCAQDTLGRAEETAERLGGGLVTHDVAECRAALAAIRGSQSRPQAAGLRWIASASADATHAAGLDESRERGWLVAALLLPPTLVPKQQSATVDSHYSADLLRNALDSLGRFEAGCCLLTTGLGAAVHSWPVKPPLATQKEAPAPGSCYW